MYVYICICIYKYPVIYYIYIYIYIYISCESNNGTRFGGFELDNGTRSHQITGRASFHTTKIGVSACFSDIPNSDRWVADVIDNLDPDFQHSVSFLGCVQKFAKLKRFGLSWCHPRFCLTFDTGNTTKIGVSDILLSQLLFSQNYLFELH